MEPTGDIVQLWHAAAARAVRDLEQVDLRPVARSTRVRDVFVRHHECQYRDGMRGPVSGRDATNSSRGSHPLEGDRKETSRRKDSILGQSRARSKHSNQAKQKSSKARQKSKQNPARHPKRAKKQRPQGLAEGLTVGLDLGD